jgi:hypothetical protein
VEIGGAGLCRTDLHVVEGQWQEKSQVAAVHVAACAARAARGMTCTVRTAPSRPSTATVAWRSSCAPTRVRA